jgi:hypothetical protein
MYLLVLSLTIYNCTRPIFGTQSTSTTFCMHAMLWILKLRILRDSEKVKNLLIKGQASRSVLRL